MVTESITIVLCTHHHMTQVMTQVSMIVILFIRHTHNYTLLK